MDIVRNKPNQTTTAKWFISIAMAVVAIASTYSLISGSAARYVVDTDTLLIDSVRNGELNVTVRGMGVLAPKDIRWLATTVDGKVERIHAKPGTQVKQGDLILEMSNPTLLQQLEESKWELDELEAESQALKVTLESQVLDQQTAVINEQLNYERYQLVCYVEYGLY